MLLVALAGGQGPPLSVIAMMLFVFVNSEDGVIPLVLGDNLGDTTVKLIYHRFPLSHLLLQLPRGINPNIESPLWLSAVLSQ